MSQPTGFSRAFAFFLSGFQGFSSKRHSERFSSSGLPMGTPDETWGVNSLTIAVVCESWLWQSRSSRRAEPCQDGRRNSRGVFWKWSCRRSSELYSYEGSVLSRFGPHRLRLGGEGPPRDFDLLPRRRHRFFLASHVPERPESGGRGRCSTACGGFFHSEQQKTCRFDRSCISWSVVYLIASKNIEVYPIFSFDWDFSTIHTLHFPFVIPLFDY